MNMVDYFKDAFKIGYLDGLQNVVDLEAEFKDAAPAIKIYGSYKPAFIGPLKTTNK